MSKDGSNKGPVDSDSPIEKLKCLVKNDHVNFRKTGSYTAAITMTALPIPVIAALASATFYFAMGESQWSKLLAISGGAFLALSVWFIATLCFHHATTVDRANISSYQQLINRLYQLAAWIEECEQQGNCQEPGPVIKTPNMPAINKKEVRTTFDAIYDTLQKCNNSSWMWAIGYVNIWRLIHRADEALIDIEPREEVIRDALHDEMSIMGSKIDNRNDLLIKLRLAVKNLGEQGAMYLHQQPAERREMSALGAHADCHQSLTPSRIVCTGER